MDLKWCIFVVLCLLSSVQLTKSTNRGGGVAVLIEPRPHPLLVPVLKNVAERIPLSWQLLLLCGPKTIKQIQIRKQQNHQTRQHQQPPRSKTASLWNSERLQVRSLGVNHLSLYDYNALLTSLSFWKEMNSNVILLFQTDSVLCGPPTPTTSATNSSSSREAAARVGLLEDLARDWDFVGSPWAADAVVGVFDFELVNLVGNGGLSLRNRDAMIRVYGA